MNIRPEERQIMNLEAAIQQAYENYISTGLQGLLATSPEIHREYPFYLKSGRVYISGILDVLFLDPADGAWTILDYKSNEIEARQIEEEIQKHGYDIQMQLYALAVSRLMNTDHVKSILFFTSPGCRYEHVDLSPNMLKTFETRILNSLDQLSEEILEVPQEKPACETCAYRFYGVCPLFS